MLSVYGPSSGKFCDRVSRRGFLQIGGLTVGGATLGLADILRAEPSRNPHKAVINVFLAGGPPHQDMWDLKPDAPTEIRGEFDPIATNVPGIQICEVFPQLAQVMDRCAIIRSVVGGHRATRRLAMHDRLARA